MTPIGTKLARRAVSSTARHSAHGAASKLRRKPMRAAALLSLGAAAGTVAGWVIGRQAPGPASG